MGYALGGGDRNCVKAVIRHKRSSADATMSGVTLGPTLPRDRPAAIDVLRGMAVLGMFWVSAVAYGLPHAAFFNLKSPGTNGSTDWGIAIIGEVLVDQKAVALMALLFGANVSHFADRVRANGSTSRWFVLRRALVLFGLGVPVGMHGLLWEGTPLFFFALCTPLLLLLQKRSVRLLVGLGSFWILFSAVLALDLHPETSEEEAGLGQYWVTGAHDLSDLAGTFMFLGTVTLLLGALTIGLALGRVGLLHSDPNAPSVGRMARWGVAVGLPLAIASTVWRALGGYEPDVAIIAEAPNTLSAVPLALGYTGLIMRWVASGALPWLIDRVRAVGHMALTNTALQTAFGIFVLRDYGFGRGNFSRTGLVFVVFVVWAIQLAWSKVWLQRFGYGPLEWVVRFVTYRHRPPRCLRHDARTRHAA